jgi:hypothetical protein
MAPPGRHAAGGQTSLGLMLRRSCQLDILTPGHGRRHALSCDGYAAYGKESGGDELFPEDYTAGHRRFR